MAKKNINMEDYDRWGTPPNAMTMLTPNTPEQQKLADEINARPDKPVKKIVYMEPDDYFPKDVRKKAGIGEYAKDKKQ